MPFLLATPTNAVENRSAKVDFYCAPNGNDIQTTYAKSSGKDSQAIISWKYAAPVGMTNKQRCRQVSDKFKSAWDQESLDKLTAIKDSNGVVVICALKYSKNKCDRSNYLFTLNKSSDAKEVIEQIHENLGGRVGSAPLYQSADRNTIEFKKMLLKAFKK